MPATFSATRTTAATNGPRSTACRPGWYRRFSPQSAGRFGDTLTAPDSGRDWQLFWMVNAAVALGASLIGNNLWNISSRRLPLTLSGQMDRFETLFALAYGFVFDHRWPRPLEMAAIMLLMAGVAWSVRLHATDKSQ
jgi:drug/metabolite transporter (DMT)-like permease